MKKGVYKVTEKDDDYRLHYITSVRKYRSDSYSRSRVVQGVQFLTYEYGDTRAYWIPLERGKAGDLETLESRFFYQDRISNHDAIRAIFGERVEGAEDEDEESR